MKVRKAGPFKICPPKIPTWIQSLHISGLWTSNPYKPTRPTQNFKRKKLVDGSVDSVEFQKISHFLYSLTLTFSNLSLKSEPGSSLLADVAQVRRRRFKFHVAQSAGADSRRCPFVVALAVLRWVSNSTSLLWSTWNLLLMLWSVHFDGGSVNVVLGFLVWILISLFWVLKCCCAWDPKSPEAPTRSVGLDPNVRSATGLFSVHPIQSGRVRVRLKPDPTRGQPYATFMAFFPHSLLSPHS